MLRVTKCTFLAALAVGAALAVNSGALVAQTTATLNPVADATLSAANAANNYGGAGAASVAAAGLSKGEFQSLLRFDTAAAKASFDAIHGPGNWTVQSITLKLVSANPNNQLTFFNPSAAGSFAASWMQNDVWTEGTGVPLTPTTDGVVYNNLAALISGSDQGLGGPFSFNGATSGTTTYTLTLGSGILGDVAAGTPISLRLSAADTNVSYLFNTRTKVGSEPVLSITAVPEPGTLMLLLAAAGAAVALWRRRRLEA